MSGSEFWFYVNHDNFIEKCVPKYALCILSSKLMQFNFFLVGPLSSCLVSFLINNDMKWQLINYCLFIFFFFIIRELQLFLSRINVLQSVFSVGDQTKLVFFILNVIFVNDNAQLESTWAASFFTSATYHGERYTSDYGTLKFVILQTL